MAEAPILSGGTTVNLFRANFHELYRRHLCRHSQFGLNVWHLIAVVGIYFSLYGIAFALPGARWIVASALTAYLLILAFNVPWRVFVLDCLVVGALLALFLALPQIPVWIHLVLLLVWHRFQVWQHRVYDKSHDMHEFADKYRKGPLLFVLLAVYELPILINFLVFEGRTRAEHGA
jgi:hypothetical protein